MINATYYIISSFFQRTIKIKAPSKQCHHQIFESMSMSDY